MDDEDDSSTGSEEDLSEEVDHDAYSDASHEDAATDLYDFEDDSYRRGLDESATDGSQHAVGEARLVISEPPQSGRERGRSKSPRRGKKKSSKSPKSKKGGSKSRSKSKTKSKSPGRGKSKSRSKSKGRSKSPKSKKGKKASRSRSKSPKGKKKGKKGKRKKGGKKGKKGRSFQQMGRKEIQAALDRTVYEARIQDLERQLERARFQVKKVLKMTDEDSEVKDFISKEMQVELEHQQTVIQDLMTKAAEDRRARRRQERQMQEQLVQQEDTLRKAESQVASLQKVVFDSSAMWEDAQKALLAHDGLLKEIKALKEAVHEKEAKLGEYEGRLTILQRAAEMAGLIHKTKHGDVKAIGGATGLVPVLLEGMKMFPQDRVLQREMCVLITHIAFTAEDYITMAKYDGLELILTALENHRASRPLVSSALRMLWKFAIASPELRDKLRGYHGLAVMLSILTVIPQQTVRRLEFFAGRTIAYLMPPRVSKHCPPEILAEEVEKAKDSRPRRTSEGTLPFLNTPTISATNNAPTRRKSSSSGSVRVPPPPENPRAAAALPGSHGENSTLLLSTWDLIKILLTFLTWSTSELVDFDVAAATRRRERKDTDDKPLLPLPPPTDQAQGPSSHISSNEEEEDEEERELWRPNPSLARRMAGDAIVAIVAAVEARDDGSGCRRLAFSKASLSIVLRTWRVFFDTTDVVMASCVLVRNALLADPLHRAEQLTFLRDAGLDRLLKASQRRLCEDPRVMTELITLSRIFFVEVVF